jgi:hypothetical protein
MEYFKLCATKICTIQMIQEQILLYKTAVHSKTGDVLT